MSGGPFLNIKVPKELLERLDDYLFATRKPPGRRGEDIAELSQRTPAPRARHRSVTDR